MMNDLTLTFERESGLVIAKGWAAGVAGEAPLSPVPGLNLAFDRVDGHLCRVIMTTLENAGSISLGEEVQATVARLFGPEAVGVVADAVRSPWGASLESRVLSPEPGLAGMLSSLARLDATRATSPVPPSSPWWGAEAAELAEYAGLPGRAQAEARQARAKLARQLDGLDTAMLPGPAARAARRVAAIHAATESAAVSRPRAALGGATGEWSRRSGSRAATVPPMPVFDVAAEVESLEKDRLRLTGLNWNLDPRWVPEGLFQPGLSPYSDLFIRCEGAGGPIRAEALLAPGADYGRLSDYQIRLVDPSIRRILARGGFSATLSRARAELQLKFSLDELPEGWVEVGSAAPWPVSSAKVHRMRRALRWADAALRAERAPVALAPASTRGDWAAFAAAAWGRCGRDWAAAGDANRAYLAARRQAVIDSGTCIPRVPIGGPAYLAEILGG
jgi:hypothetical protein